MFAEPYSGGDVVHHTPGTPDEQPGALTGDLPVAGLRRGRAARRERRALHPLPLDGHAGVEPLRDAVAGRPPAARRAPGPRPRAPGDRAAACPPHEPPIAGENIRLGDGRAGAGEGAPRRRPLPHRVDTGTAPADALALGHTLPRGSPRGGLLDGRTAGPQTRTTNRGVEVTVKTGPGRHPVLESTRAVGHGFRRGAAPAGNGPARVPPARRPALTARVASGVVDAIARAEASIDS